MDFEYETLNSSTSFPQRESPLPTSGILPIPDRSDPIWEELFERMNRDHSIPREVVKDLLYSSFPDETHNQNFRTLYQGVSNLINLTLDSQDKGTPIQRFIFLDKSARLGAYVYNTMWNYLVEQGVVNNEYRKPTIEFFNSHSQSRPNRLQKYLIRSRFDSSTTNHEGGVVVVDEFIETGASVRSALRDIRVASRGVSLLEDMMPGFYVGSKKEYSYKMGVEDLQIKPEVQEVVDLINRKFDRKEMIALVNSVKSRSEREMRQLLKEIGNKYGFNKYFQKEDTDVERDLIKYFRSCGGYLSVQPDSTSIGKTSRYRYGIAKATKMYVDLITQ